MSKQLYYNGTIITIEKSTPIVEGVIVENENILAIGARDELEAKHKGAELIDLEGMTMMPGFIDSHSHIGQSTMFPLFPPSPAGNTDDVPALKKKLREEFDKNIMNEGDWFVGMGYDNSVFPDGQHPTKQDLDEISAEWPILMMHASGHIGVANSKALELMGYTNESQNPEGGILGRTADGKELTGLLEENAMIGQLRKGTVKFPSGDAMIQKYVAAQQYYASFGITTAQDGGINGQSAQIIDYCNNNDMMLIDICAYISIESCQNVLGRQEYANVPWVKNRKLGGAKLFLDGSPQGKTAWLTQPYHVVPEGQSEEYKGYGIFEDEVVVNYLKQCIENNWQFLVHCNGDAAIDQFIRTYDAAIKETGKNPELRPVVVHAQTIREDQLDRIQELGILPTFFHDHVFYWGDYHRDSVLGEERASRISPIASAKARGINFTLHQDTPVVPPNIMLAIHNAVNRKTKSGQVLGAEQRITVEDALRAVTLNSAYQYFDEDIKGSIKPGKYADFVILDRSPLEVASEELKDIQVMKTIKQGKVVYSK